MEQGAAYRKSARISEREALREATHRHWKGGLYRVLAVENVLAMHGDEIVFDNPMVVYKHLWPHDYGTIWRRPFDEFHDVHPNGKKRFVKLERDDA